MQGRQHKLVRLRPLRRRHQDQAGPGTGGHPEPEARSRGHQLADHPQGRCPRYRFLGQHFGTKLLLGAQTAEVIPRRRGLRPTHIREGRRHRRPSLLVLHRSLGGMASLQGTRRTVVDLGDCGLAATWRVCPWARFRQGTAGRSTDTLYKEPDLIGVQTPDRLLRWKAIGYLSHTHQHHFGAFPCALSIPVAVLPPSR